MSPQNPEAGPRPSPEGTEHYFINSSNFLGLVEEGGKIVAVKMKLNKGAAPNFDTSEEARVLYQIYIDVPEYPMLKGPQTVRLKEVVRDEEK